ncbi:MAG: transporter substrate-binding domain-containing protein [Gammaproteobacteria bacterium]|nr:transporter substrate-binding domain-containing protein [Gammaproteobacteria bacterium]
MNSSHIPDSNKQGQFSYSATTYRRSAASDIRRTDSVLKERFRIVSCVIALFAILLTGTIPANATDNIHINVDDANPPFMFMRQGKSAGLYPTLMAAVFHEMRVEVDIESKPWRRALAEIEASTAGVGGIYKNSERIKKFDYSDPLFTERMNVYVVAYRDFPFSGLNDLMKKRVGVIRGWSYGNEFDEARRSGAVIPNEVSDDKQNFQKLNMGRVDAVLSIEQSANALIKSYPNLRLAGTLAENPTYLAFNKSAHMEAFLARFNEALARLKKSGEFERLVTKELKR